MSDKYADAKKRDIASKFLFQDFYTLNSERGKLSLIAHQMKSQSQVWFIAGLISLTALSMWIDRKWARYDLVTCNTWKCQDEICTISDCSPSIKFAIVESSILKGDR